MRLHDVDTHLTPTDAGLLVFRSQEIPSEFLDGLKSERLASASIREGEFHHVADVPAAVWDLWTCQGLNPNGMSAREIVAKLNADDLGVFVTTSKALR